jgi:DNA-binding XRE family transcriptional regulator
MLRAMAEEPQMIVQKLRIQRGWSQEQLAELTGLRARTIQRIERGRNGRSRNISAGGCDPRSTPEPAKKSVDVTSAPQNYGENSVEDCNCGAAEKIFRHVYGEA